MHLTEDDLKHLQQMTTRTQMLVYIALIKDSPKNRIISLDNSLPSVVDLTHFTEGTIRDAFSTLLLDDHLRFIGEGSYTIGGTRKWSTKYS